MAKSIYAWLRPGNGLGPQVFFRSLPAPHSEPGFLRPALPGESRSPGPLPRKKTQFIERRQIVIPLIDENMVADPTWRHWVDELATTGERDFLPIALDSTAYNMGPFIRRRNFLRPAGLSSRLPPVPSAEASARIEIPEIVVRSLRKQITEAMRRLLLCSPPEGGADQAPMKVQIFLSHAKVDGAGHAKRIREYIYGQTQHAAFFDENDIPFGRPFAPVLDGSIDAAAAMIVVRSERYASRPWCRKEVADFRRPTPSVDQRQWQLSPLLVVDCLERGKATTGIPDFGNSPIIRWDDSILEQEEQIVTSLLRDVLMHAYHHAVGSAILQSPDTSAATVVNWIPDPVTLLRIPRSRLGAGGGDVLPRPRPFRPRSRYLVRPVSQAPIAVLRGSPFLAHVHRQAISFQGVARPRDRLLDRV